MKTKTKILALLEIAVVLCSVFLVAIPAIAAEQKQEMQKVSASEVTATSEDDYVLGIYGNANEDDTIDMRDLTYVKLIFFGKKPEMELSDAKYDGKINPLDFIQIKLIIVGKEKEITIVDDTVTDTHPNGKPVTVKKPVERIISLNSYVSESLRTLKSKDKIVGIDKYNAAKKNFFPDISKLPVVGSQITPDIEKILSLNPDIVISYGSDLTRWTADLEDKLKGTSIILVRIDLYKPETLTEDIIKLGYIINKRNEAKEFNDFHKSYLDKIKDRTEELSKDEKPRVYIESQVSIYKPYSSGSGFNTMCVTAGGRNIAAEANLPGGPTPKVDPEWVVEQNPDIIIKAVTYKISGYEVDDPSGMAAVRDEVMNRPELANVRAVKNERVYLLTTGLSGSKSFVAITYLAKWFHPELFKDLDPQGIHQEYIDRFCPGLDFDVFEHGVFVYPPLE